MAGDTHWRLRRIWARSAPMMPIISSRKALLDGGASDSRPSRCCARKSKAPSATMPNAISASRSGGQARLSCWASDRRSRCRPAPPVLPSPAPEPHSAPGRAPASGTASATCKATPSGSLPSESLSGMAGSLTTPPCAPSPSPPVRAFGTRAGFSTDRRWRQRVSQRREASTSTPGTRVVANAKSAEMPRMRPTDPDENSTSPNSWPMRKSISQMRGAIMPMSRRQSAWGANRPNTTPAARASRIGQRAFRIFILT